MPRTKAKPVAKRTWKTRPVPVPSGRMTAPARGVKVRMYRQGLGDCFLLAFPTGKEEPFYMMIDCGVLRTPKHPMTKVVNDIAKATGGNIHLLAVTHEHWDHISGFVDARDVFRENIKVHEVWLAWTEDPGNPLARELRAEHSKAKAALGAALQGMRAAGSSSADGVEALLSFFGGALDATARIGRTEEAMNTVKGLSGSAPRYCRPADPPITRSEVSGARFYVLGPPENRERLGKTAPSKSQRETYGLALSAASGFLAAAARKSEFGDPAIRELSFPFDGRHRIAPAAAKEDPFFRKLYFDPDPACRWQMIDTDWLETAGQLALQLDNDTNNTSLVIAIELARSRKVLLFAADAQVGNWLSWNDQSWDGVTARDLLARTVLYKVGHHGSHNATLREEGLERMTSPELVALIPVDHDVAIHMKPSPWNMPFPELFNRLKEKSMGRVICADDANQVVSNSPPQGVSGTDWADFQKRLTATDLYFELTIEG